MPFGVPILPPVSGLFLHQQITEALREAILSGEIAEGTRLPSMEELARRWNTSYFTIRQAMKPLVREGLVEHRRRVGSVVKGVRPSLTSVGIYYGADILGMAETNFYRSLHAALKRRLGKRGVELLPFIDEREEVAQATPLPALAKAVEERSVQAIVIPMSSRAEAEWLRELPLPMAQLGSVNVPWAVKQDVRKPFSDALARLRQQGARSAGMIANLPRDADPALREELPLLSHFREAAAERGIQTRPEWCQLPGRILSPGEMEAYGYRALLDLYESGPLPDALLSTSDVIGRGVLMGILQLGISVPARLHVVQWVNAGTGLFTPLAIDRVVLEEERVAEALLHQIDLQMNGQPVRPIAVNSHLLPFQPTSSHEK